MSITDELREFKGQINVGLAPDRVLALRAEINCIADRIDAEADDNERFRRDVEPFCDRLREAAAERADVTIYGVDYVALPVDADGLPIHIGDKLYGYGETTVVKGLTLGDDGWSMTCENGLWFDFTAFTHHKPTVEDVLREFICDHEEGVRDEVDLIAEYAKRLKLAGSDAE